MAKKIKIGFAPTRRSIFSAPDAIKYRGLTAKRLQELGIEFVDIDDINEELISNNLYTKGQPDPDFILRPSGEKRISNFLLWQIAYSEFVYMDVLWPDFTRKDLDEAILEFNKRNRRFGGV